MDLITKIKNWLENEVYDGADVVEAKNNDEEEITSDGSDDIIFGRAECAESLLKQINKWENE